ncbi:hypothetical protein [Ferruginibacter sp. HRS2-29]|uniref:hypothetical protein n=1 Tax=Ferruginibacter sp. HRS2-29 TaxID=2487334 RepID=UPI0020CCAE1B|nr:hypothetical protein [Ferruginibacter sp. HRS2-29]
MLLLCLSTAVGFSQQNVAAKTRLFATLPDRIDLNSDVFKNVMTLAEGAAIAIPMGDGYTFQGIVLSNEIKYSNLQSVTIRSANLDNSFFSISKITNADNSISYTGRIMNNNALDGYEIKKAEAGNYKLQKFETARILQDCSYN